jgi:hypothetical protein
MMLLVANAVAKKPRAGAAGSDLQIGAVANCVASRLGDFCQVLGRRVVPHVHLPVYGWEITRKTFVLKWLKGYVAGAKWFSGLSWKLSKGMRS